MSRMQHAKRDRLLPRNEAPSESWGSLGPPWPSTDSTREWPSKPLPCSPPRDLWLAMAIWCLVNGDKSAKRQAGFLGSSPDFHRGVGRLGMRSSFPEKNSAGHSLPVHRLRSAQVSNAQEDIRTFVGGSKACGVGIVATTGALEWCILSVVAKEVKQTIGPTLCETSQNNGATRAER
ncbi:hypothetical protein OPT61_g2441 [Boeremia exigua]|uniref:Uncharacterized protein n=1 Tax=Boeremia exigua TaxID=749465 RepID=A0ACC2ILJ1_9PLEO|nr:hypothetical protein OPT61_g2441 [Boeremia exigua]